MNFSVQFPNYPVQVRFQEPFSDADLLRFCEENKLLRVERETTGELTLMSPVGMEGAGHEFNLALELGIWARSDGRGRGFGSNAGFTLPDKSMRSPDASWISSSRIAALTAEQRDGFAPVCPEFVIEVRSHSDRLRPLQLKMQSWLANGAELGWLIDPERRVVEVYRPGEELEVHENPTSVQGSGPVAGFELVLSRIWG